MAQPSPTVAQTPTPSPTPSPTDSASPTLSPSPAVEVAPVRAPINPKTSSVTTSAVTLVWSPAPNGGEAVQFLVFRDGKQIGKTKNTRFVDDQVTASSTFVYEVVAVGEDGSRARSKEVSVETPAPPTTGGGDSGGGGGGGGDGCTVEEFLAGEC